jgi:hypothetical protein
MTNEMITARFDEFAREFMRDFDRNSLRDAIMMHANANSISTESIIDFIDAEFDDDFAIITDDDENAYSIYIEFIECNRIAFATYLNMRISRMIA